LNKGSVDNKHQSKQDSHSGSEDFMEQLSLVRAAESKALAIIEQAKSQASKIEAAAREKSVEISAKSSEKSVAAKNEVLARKREQTDAKIQEMLKDAKKQAEKIRGKKLSEKAIAELAAGKS